MTIYQLVGIESGSHKTLIITDDHHQVTKEMTLAVGRGGWHLCELKVRVWQGGVCVETLDAG